MSYRIEKIEILKNNVTFLNIEPPKINIADIEQYRHEVLQSTIDQKIIEINESNVFTVNLTYTCLN